MVKSTLIKPHPDNPIYREGFRTYVPVSPKLLEASQKSKAGPQKDDASPSPASPSIASKPQEKHSAEPPPSATAPPSNSKPSSTTPPDSSSEGPAAKKEPESMPKASTKKGQNKSR